MTLPKWQRNGGRDFAFYHPHSGFEWEDLDTSKKYQEMLCHDFQVGPAHASLARIRYGVIVLNRGSVYGCDRDREMLQAPEEVSNVHPETASSDSIWPCECQAWCEPMRSQARMQMLGSVIHCHPLLLQMMHGSIHPNQRRCQSQGRPWKLAWSEPGCMSAVGNNGRDRTDSAVALPHVHAPDDRHCALQLH